MVAKQQTTSTGNKDGEYSSLPERLLEDLEGLELHYPGWEKDLNAAKEYFRGGLEAKFHKTFRKLTEKQDVFNDYKAFTRMSELASLELAYPGNDLDKHAVEEWHLKNPSTEITDRIFHDKLEGLKNKDRLFFGDRSHQHIQELDSLELSYPSWEADYQAAVTAHCDTPGRSFANALHRLQQRQRVFDGDRTHWRLVTLENLQLTYPGWENDVEEVVEWHFRNADSTVNDKMYAEVIEGMKDQQQLFLGFPETDNAGLHDTVAEEVVQERDEAAEAAKMARSYESIAESICAVEKQKKMLEERSALDSDSTSSPSESLEQRLPPPLESPSLSLESNSTGHSFSPSSTLAKSEDSGPSRTELDLGKCTVCQYHSRTHVFVPCGHLCACAKCSHQAMEEGAVCPMCRMPVETTLRVFLK